VPEGLAAQRGAPAPGTERALPSAERQPGWRERAERGGSLVEAELGTRSRGQRVVERSRRDLCGWVLRGGGAILGGGQQSPLPGQTVPKECLNLCVFQKGW